MAETIVELLTDVADAIREKKGSTEPINAQDFANEILSIEGGEQPFIEEKDVNFYDYDGTLLFAYTLAEAQALSELPTPQGHEGLVFQGWNWEYEDVIALDYPMNIGALYNTDSGDTRIYIRIEDEYAKNFQLAVEGNLSIDWGDGNIESISNSNIKYHTYADYGDYVISIKALSGGLGFGSGGATGIYGVFLAPSKGRIESILKVEFGDNVTRIAPYLFTYCCNLKSVSIPNTITSIGGSAFRNCISLKYITIPRIETIPNLVFAYSGIKNVSLPPTINTIDAAFESPNLEHIMVPDSVTNLVTTAFQRAYSLEYIRLSKNITILPSSLFSNCKQLKILLLPNGIVEIGSTCINNCDILQYLIIPPSVQKIGSYGIYTLLSLAYIDFSQHTTIPELVASNSIGNLASSNGTKIIVPDELYDEWIAATNWTTHASKIVKNSEYIRPI